MHAPSYTLAHALRSRTRLVFGNCSQLHLANSSYNLCRTNNTLSARVIASWFLRAYDEIVLCSLHSYSDNVNVMQSHAVEYKTEHNASVGCLVDANLEAGKPLDGWEEHVLGGEDTDVGR